MPSGTFNELISSVSGDEYPVSLLELTHVDLATPFRIVNDNTDLVYNGDTFYKSSFELTLPTQPKDGLGYASLAIGNPGDKELTDFIDDTLGVGAQITLYLVLRSNPNVSEWTFSAPVYGFVIKKEVISCRIQKRNMNTIRAFPTLYGSKYSPSLL